MLKWPDVPAVYGWLRLDRRGRWRIRMAADSDSAEERRFEPIGNAAMTAFIARNYLPDERGCWYFQNGPQRVFVSLACAPLVYAVAESGLTDQCGRGIGHLESAWLDEEGSLILKADHGVGILDDRDLGVFSDCLADGFLELGGKRHPVDRVEGAELESRFGYVREPGP